ncbi:MAG: hypothetical protein ABWY08_06915 [Comamonas sp.]
MRAVTHRHKEAFGENPAGAETIANAGSRCGFVRRARGLGAVVSPHTGGCLALDMKVHGMDPTTK